MTGHLPQVTIRVFGGAGVTVGTEPVAIGGPRQRRLLALLTMQAGQVVSVDWLAEHLWDADGRPAETVPAIRVYMSRLRRAMPGDTAVWLATVASGYRLDAPPEAVEHLRFRMLRSEAAKATRVGDPRTAYDLLDEALGIWTGEPFPELDDLSVAQAELEQLRVDRHDAMEERWQAALELGRHTQITGELAAFTSEHGLRDRAVRQHALALHRSGRAGDGLAVLATHRRLLAEQTGLDPSPEAAELEHMLLSGADMPASSRRLRGYRLIEETAGGAFSIVWRGLQPSVDRQVAVKQIRSALAARPDFIRRFEAEARLVARLEHPHIVPLIDFWRDPDSAYLVMRWMRGGTLERRLEDGPLPLQATLTLVGQVGRALSSAHVRGVIHRDVKPANILLDEDGNAFLGDFGIAMVDAPTQSVDNTPSSPGTPAYASPEQRRGEPAGPPADVFSLGVVLAECLGGTVQIECSTAAAVFEQPLRERALARATRHGDVPEHVLTALERATAHDPIARFQTVSGFLAALGDAPMHVATPGAVIPSVDDPPNPYVGLRAFDDGDAPRFHGRERLVEELVDQLRDSAPPQSVVG